MQDPWSNPLFVLATWEWAHPHAFDVRLGIAVDQLVAEIESVHRLVARIEERPDSCE